MEDSEEYDADDEATVGEKGENVVARSEDDDGDFGEAMSPRMTSDDDGDDDDEDKPWVMPMTTDCGVLFVSDSDLTELIDSDVGREENYPHFVM